MWGIELQRQSAIPLKRQIYQAFRNQIIGGRLEAGEILPSTRELAVQLAVARNTVCEAYEMLYAEGFILSHQGSPTRVAEGLCVAQTTEIKPLKEKRRETIHYAADFRTGRPDLKFFPRFLWYQMLHKTLEELPLNQMDYGGPEGIQPLREEIAAWLYRGRGLTVNPQDIFITAGATHALHLIADLLYKEGRKFLIEDPCHVAMLRILQLKGCPVIPVPVDGQGLQVEYLDSKNACGVYVTPSHQFPLGGILPAGRRAALIRFAIENSIYIVEDDYDSEFRYCGEPIAPLYSMNPQQVIYVGTFSKTLFPALRIGYVILPQKLHGQWRFLRTYSDVQNPPFEQAALAKYLHTRKLDRYLQRMRKVYGERRRVLLQALEESFGTKYRSWGDAAGLHLAIEFPNESFDHEFAKKSKMNGIRVTPVEEYSIRKGKHLDKLLLGYGHLEPDEIRKGISVLAGFMKQV